MATRKWRPRLLLACYLSAAVLASAYLADTLAAQLPRCYVSTSWQGRDNLFLALLLPAVMLPLLGGHLQPPLQARARRANGWLCAILVVICLLFGGKGLAAFLAIDACLQLWGVIRTKP